MPILKICSGGGGAKKKRRQKKFIRNLVKENRLTVNDFIYPVFIVDGKDKKEPIPEMPGLFRYSLDNLKNEIKNILSLNIPAIAIFPKIIAIYGNCICGVNFTNTLHNALILQNNTLLGLLNMS